MSATSRCCSRVSSASAIAPRCCRRTPKHEPRAWDCARLFGQRAGEASGLAEPPSLSGHLTTAPRTFDEAQLQAAALRERPDVQARQRASEAAQARIALATRNRWIDVSLNVSWQRSLFSEPFASPQYDALSAMLSLPLPLSRTYRGELSAAEANARGAAAQAEATAVRATVEVTQALVRYRATVERLRLYTQGVLNDAEQVHKAMLYSYQRGSASLSKCSPPSARSMRSTCPTPTPSLSTPAG